MKNDTKHPKLLDFELPNCADAVDVLQDTWVSVDGDGEDTKRATLVAVGLYELHEAEQKRVGGIQLCELFRTFDGDDYHVWMEVGSLVDIGCGILDLRWVDNFVGCGVEKRNGILAAVGSDSALHILTSKAVDGGHDWEEIYKAPGQDESSLSVALAIGLDIIGTEVAAFSLSNGTAIITRDCMHVAEKWKAHNSEVWSISLTPISDGRIVATGADDCTIKLWDTRAGTGNPVAMNQRGHESGVTAITHHEGSEYSIFTGSYDNYIRVWDTRNFNCPVNKQVTSGGVWRLRWHPQDKNVLMVAACHGGCEVFRIPSHNSCEEFEPVTTYREHSSLVYGIGTVKANRIPSRELDNYSDEEEEGKKRRGHLTKLSEYREVNERQQLDVSEELCSKEMTSLLAFGKDTVEPEEVSPTPSTSQHLQRSRGIHRKHEGGAGVCGENCDLYLSCSFYDKSLHLWAHNPTSANFDREQ